MEVFAHVAERANISFCNLTILRMMDTLIEKFTEQAANCLRD